MEDYFGSLTPGGQNRHEKELEKESHSLPVTDKNALNKFYDLKLNIKLSRFVIAVTILIICMIVFNMCMPKESNDAYGSVVPLEGLELLILIPEFASAILGAMFCYYAVVVAIALLFR